MSGEPKAMKLLLKLSEEPLRKFITKLIQIIESLN